MLQSAEFSLYSDVNRSLMNKTLHSCYLDLVSYNLFDNQLYIYFIIRLIQAHW